MKVDIDRSSSTRLSPGQEAADQHVGKNGAYFECRRDIKELNINVGDKIWVSYYKIESKN